MHIKRFMASGYSPKKCPPYPWGLSSHCFLCCYCVEFFSVCLLFFGLFLVLPAALVRLKIGFAFRFDIACFCCLAGALSTF